MSNNRTQRLTLRSDEPIVIETPEGLICISKGKRNRDLVIELPGDAKAFVGTERAMEHARFVRQTESGELMPTYSVLVPVTGENGTLKGVKPQVPFRLAGSSQTAPVMRLAAV